MGPSMVMGWRRRAPRDVTSSQWGEGPQINTWKVKCKHLVRAVEVSIPPSPGNTDTAPAPASFPSPLHKVSPLDAEPHPHWKPHPRVAVDVLKVAEAGHPAPGSTKLFPASALGLLLGQPGLLLSEVNVVGDLVGRQKGAVSGRPTGLGVGLSQGGCPRSRGEAPRHTRAPEGSCPHLLEAHFQVGLA